jgi:hypothetical protein
MLWAVESQVKLDHFPVDEIQARRTLRSRRTSWTERTPISSVTVASGVDRMLIAGDVAQQLSANDDFSVDEANSLLTGQGVEIEDPARPMKENLLAKRVLRYQDRFRVSQIAWTI